MGPEVTPSNKDIGADIRGLNIAEPLAAAELAAVEDAFVNHQVLRFRDQPLTPQQFADFSAQFGHLQRHIQTAYWHPDVPEIVFNRNVDDEGNFDELAARRGVTDDLRTGWHSDTTYDAIPAKATSVHALEVPSQGGNTCFASATRAYELMPDNLRQRVADLKVEFALGNNPRNKTANYLGSKLTDEDKARPIVTHPVICQHPISKKPAIYANPLIAVGIQGIGDEESDEILEALYDCLHAAGADEYRWEQEWQVGDTILWENRGGLMHTGRLDYPEGERRIMIRCTIGSSPIEAYQA
jgi:taurine dioxygenase